MTPVVISTLLGGLFVLLVAAVSLRGERTLPLRWVAYRWLRFIPTPVCLWLSLVSLVTAITVMRCTRMWLVDGTVQQWTVNASLLLWLTVLNVPACRWLAVPGRPREAGQRNSTQATYQVTFERVSETEVGLHIRRTDGRCAIVRQKLPKRVSNVHLALNAVADYREQLLKCGVRTVRVASPDVSPAVIENMDRHLQRLGVVDWQPLPPKPLARTKRAIIGWLRAREPGDASEPWWRFARTSLVAALTPSAWRWLARIWAASAGPMVERGVRLQLSGD